MAAPPPSRYDYPHKFENGSFDRSPAGAELSAWSPTGGDFHSPHLFGLAVLI